jgi:hypothetical protein
MPTSPKTAAPKQPVTKKRSTKPALEAAPDPFNEICTIRIELRHTEPLIWREVAAPTSISLQVLHDIVQIAMGWHNSHLWDFRIAGLTYGPPMESFFDLEPPRSAAKTRLRDVLKPRKTRIDYLYDMGDSWEHRLTVSHVRQGEPDGCYPRLVAGEWAGPPEDCGGLPGFYDVLDALADPDHPEHADVKEWHDGYDPAHVDAIRINFLLGRISNRRAAGRVRSPKPAPKPEP